MSRRIDPAVQVAKQLPCAALAVLLSSAAALGCSSSDGTGPSPGGASAAGGTAGAGGTGAAGGGAEAGAAGFAAGGGGSGGGTTPAVEQVTIPRGGVSARLSYELAYDNVAEGDWYRDSNNETATLAWGESYVMMSLAAMFRATGNPDYLARLVWHADGVLAQRDDQRGVADYRGISGACWQNRHYQPNQEPYCYVVHSGMIGYPMVDFARLVAQAGLESEPTWDGLTFGDKAAAYVAAATETVAYHDDQWNSAGYYVFRPDASFLDYPGVDLPLNQSNAMGQLLLVLHDVTGDADYLAKAQALAQRFAAQLTVGSSGEYLWNYWGGSYASPGEDISHAAINVEFARMAAERSVVFDATDVDAFANTFLARIYVDDRTLTNNVGGGDTNGSSYRAQIARWLGLSATRTAVYTAVRDIYDLDYLPENVASGSLLYGWALLAEHEPIHREHFFYYVDWNDPNGASDGDWREATAYGANLLTEPAAADEPCVVPVMVDAPRVTALEQYDGTAYHALARWQPTGGPLLRHMPYEPRWPHVYWNGGVLYQLADAFVAGAGVEVLEPTGVELPAITSTAPPNGQVGEPLSYQPTGTGQAPLWWALARFPVGARIDPMTGAIDWSPPAPGLYPMTIVLQSDWGRAEQSFEIVVP